MDSAAEEEASENCDNDDSPEETSENCDTDSAEDYGSVLVPWRKLELVPVSKF